MSDEVRPWQWVDAEDGRSDLCMADGTVLISGADVHPMDPTVPGAIRHDLAIAAVPQMLALLRWLLRWALEARDDDAGWEGVNALLARIDGEGSA